MKVTTKTGDKGTTSLFDGTRVTKDDIRIELNGELDELNALLGLCKATINQKEPYETLQRELMKIMAVVARASGPVPSDAAQSQNEQTAAILTAAIQRMEDYVREVTATGEFDFVLPGKSLPDAVIHVARTKARSCERRFVSVNRQLSQETPANGTPAALPPTIGIYLNRLSDYLWCLALGQ